MDKRELAKILQARLKEKGLDHPAKPIEWISVLPGYPDSVLELYPLTGYSDPPIYALRSIKIYGKEIAKYKAPSSKMSLGEAVGKANIYKEYALEIFYTQVQLLSLGIPPGSYDTIKPSGLKSLHIPDPTMVKAAIKPETLLLIVGLSDGMNIDKPMYIYYLAFETTGSTYDNVLVKVTVVVSVVIDEHRVLYEDYMSMMGICFFYYVGSETPLSVVWPATTVYGFIGVLASLFIFFITIDEAGKYYMVTASLFVLQVVLYILVNVLAGVEPGKVHLSALNIGSWLIAIFVLWIPAYLLATYRYYSSPDIEPSPSTIGALLEGVGLAFLITVLVAISIFHKGVTGGMIALGGLGGFLLLVMFLSFIDFALGYLLGKLWATMKKIGGFYSI